jgi:protein-S-isoprenylcysteine O-methyltransferase Ste14
MNINISHLIFGIAFFSMFVLRVYYGRKAHRSREDVDIKESKLNMAVRALFGLGYVGSLFLYVFAPGLFEWGVFSLPDGVRWLGALITVGSVLLLWWVQWALDVQFDTTLHTQAEHKLIQHGPYRWVRHPMYTALFLMGLGWFLLTANWFVGVPLMVGIVVVVLSRVQNEEKVLIDLFGDEYRDYMETTGRFFPALFR